jgi:hypothetical protein
MLRLANIDQHFKGERFHPPALPDFEDRDATQALANLISEVEAQLARGRHQRWLETRPTADVGNHTVAVGPATGRMQCWHQGDAADRTYWRRARATPKGPRS